jgi:hypothetical protein
MLVFLTWHIPSVAGSMMAGAVLSGPLGPETGGPLQYPVSRIVFHEDVLARAVAASAASSRPGAPANMGQAHRKAATSAAMHRS